MVVAAHEQRLAILDPLLPTTHPLPDQEPGDALLAAGGGAAITRHVRPDPESFLATWGAADQHRLLPRVGGPEPVKAMGALLAQWREQVAKAATPDDPDSEATLTWPARDTAMIRLFLARGLVPAAVTAARPAGRPSPPAAEVVVRNLQPDDAAAAAALWLEEVRWDAQFGSVTERPSTAGAIRDRLSDALSGDLSWMWVAGTAGQVHGLLVVSPPEQSEWAATLVSRSPAAYLTCLVVTAGRRGGGVGAALVRRAHAALDAAGVAVTLLHYTALNPLSGPFWHRCGYRPLWTTWHARPASSLRTGICP